MLNVKCDTIKRDKFREDLNPWQLSGHCRYNHDNRVLRSISMSKQGKCACLVDSGTWAKHDQRHCANSVLNHQGCHRWASEISHATIGNLKLKGKYFPSSGSDDKCDTINNEVMEIEHGMELKGFDCSGKKDGDVMCYCVGEEIDGGKVNYSNICGKCSLAVMPTTPEFGGRFQFWRFVSISVKMFKMLAEGKGGNKDMIVHGYTDNINLPPLSPGQMMYFGQLLVNTVNEKSKLTPEEKVMVVGKMREIFERVMAGNLATKMREGLAKAISGMAKMYGCDISMMDSKSTDFMMKIDKLVASLMSGVKKN